MNTDQSNPTLTSPPQEQQQAEYLRRLKEQGILSWSQHGLGQSGGFPGYNFHNS